MKLKILFFFILTLSNFSPLIRSISLASNINNNKEISDKNINSYTNKKIQSEYLIGPGDKIYITFAGLDIYTNFYDIDPNGYIDLPEINKLFVDQLSLEELKKLLLRSIKTL